MHERPLLLLLLFNRGKMTGTLVECCDLPRIGEGVNFKKIILTGSFVTSIISSFAPFDRQRGSLATYCCHGSFCLLYLWFSVTDSGVRCCLLVGLVAIYCACDSVSQTVEFAVIYCACDSESQTVEFVVLYCACDSVSQTVELVVIYWPVIQCHRQWNSLFFTVPMIHYQRLWSFTSWLLCLWYVQIFLDMRQWDWKACILRCTWESWETSVACNRTAELHSF